MVPRPDGRVFFYVMKIEFKDQYSHPEWQKKRLEVLKRDKFLCLLCEVSERTLHVHHRYYKRDKMLWEYDDKCYLTVCDECHEYLHNVQDILNEKLSTIDPMYLECFALSNLRKVSQLLLSGELSAVRKYAKTLTHNV
jgi:hypothetical protein